MERPVELSRTLNLGLPFTEKMPVSSIEESASFCEPAFGADGGRNGDLSCNDSTPAPTAIAVAMEASSDSIVRMVRN